MSFKPHVAWLCVLCRHDTNLMRLKLLLFHFTWLYLNLVHLYSVSSKYYSYLNIIYHQIIPFKYTDSFCWHWCHLSFKTYTLNLCTLFLNHFTWGLFPWCDSHFILTTLQPPHLFMCRTDHSCCHLQARGELRDSWRCVHPQKCPLHALPGLQWKARHAACERGQLWKGKALQKCLENTWKLKRSVAGVLNKMNDV